MNDLSLLQVDLAIEIRRFDVAIAGDIARPEYEHIRRNRLVRTDLHEIARTNVLPMSDLVAAGIATVVYVCVCLTETIDTCCTEDKANG